MNRQISKSYTTGKDTINWQYTERGQLYRLRVVPHFSSINSQEDIFYSVLDLASHAEACVGGYIRLGHNQDSLLAEVSHDEAIFASSWETSAYGYFRYHTYVIYSITK